jgi:hypothetical protein
MHNCELEAGMYNGPKKQTKWWPEWKTTRRRQRQKYDSGMLVGCYNKMADLWTGCTLYNGLKRKTWRWIGMIDRRQFQRQIMLVGTLKNAESREKSTWSPRRNTKWRIEMKTRWRNQQQQNLNGDLSTCLSDAAAGRLCSLAAAKIDEMKPGPPTWTQNKYKEAQYRSHLEKNHPDPNRGAVFNSRGHHLHMYIWPNKQHRCCDSENGMVNWPVVIARHIVVKALMLNE